MADSSKHGKKGKGSRHNRKLIVKQILVQLKTETGTRLFPLLVLALDYIEDGQIDGFGVLGELYWKWAT